MRRRTLVIPLAALAFALIGVSSIQKQLDSGNDFPIYYHASRALLEGRSPYDTASGLHGYVYLPFLALIVSPLARLPLEVAAAIWYAGNVGLATLCALLVARLLRNLPEAARSTRALPIALLVTGRFIVDNLALGQVNLFILALALVAACWETENRRLFLAGAAVGLAATVKPYAVILLAPSLLRRRWRFVQGGAFGFLVGAVLVPVALVGGERTLALLDDWGEKILAGAGAGTLQGSKIWDQSPHAALRRLLVAGPAFGETRINFLSLPPETFRAVTLGLQAVLLSLLVAVWRRRERRAPGVARLLDTALAFCGMVTLFGANLKAQFVNLLFPCALLVALLDSRLARGRAGHAALRVASAAAAGLIVLSNPGIIGRTASNWALAYSAITVGTLLVTAALFAARHTWVSEPGPEGPPDAGTAGAVDPREHPS